MNGEVFQEKMNPTHRASLCRMVRTEQLPLCLLVEYKKVKLMVDVVDGAITVGELAIIALAAGYDPATKTFLPQQEKNPSEPPAVAMGGTSFMPVEDDKVIEEKTEAPDEPEVPDEHPEEDVPLEHPKEVSGATGQAVEKPIGNLWSPGMPVIVLHDEELKQGKIVGIVPRDESDNASMTKLTVEFEGGETETFDETEVEAD